jgi:dCMP deaminase
MTRIAVDDYMMDIAALVSRRATCDRRSVGCVVTVDGRIVSTGYNGAPPKARHCSEAGHLMHDGHCIRAVHAEANAIAFAARSGVSVMGGTAYITVHPCASCMLLLASAGIRRVVYASTYRTEEDSKSTAETPLMVERWDKVLLDPKIKRGIAFTGASGTGKTTCIDSPTFAGWDVVKVGSRSTAAEMGFDSPYDVDRADLETYNNAVSISNLTGAPLNRAAQAAMKAYVEGKPSVRSKFQLKLHLAKLECEEQLVAKGGPFVTDRTPIDDLIYAQMHGHDLTDRWEAAADHIDRHYAIVFFTPMSEFQNLAEDNARMSSPVYHARFEQFLLRAYRRLGIPIVHLPFEERTAMVAASVARAMTRYSDK